MSSKMSTLLCCLITTILVVSLSQVHGRSIHKKQSLTIKDKKGQVYDCVDFYEQPTLKDPRFKYLINQLNVTTLQSEAQNVKGLGLKDGCPTGTVPILRSYNMSKSSNLGLAANGKHCIAIVRTSGPEDQFYGGVGIISIYKPIVYGKQWSLARMRLSNEGDFIEAGWMVNPSYYNDSEAHLYARFSSSFAGGCFDVECPGFVQTTRSVPLGVTPEKYSKIGQDAYCWGITIELSQDGNWWLLVGSIGTPIGFWPVGLFRSSLSNVANQIEWGGEIDNPEPDHTPPPYMGSGLTARNDLKQSAFAHIRAIVDNHQYGVDNHQYDDNPKYAQANSNCDNDGYLSLDTPFRPTFGRVIFFGGPLKNIK